MEVSVIPASTTDASAPDLPSARQIDRESKLPSPFRKESKQVPVPVGDAKYGAQASPVAAESTKGADHPVATTLPVGNSGRGPQPSLSNGAQHNDGREGGAAGPQGNDTSNASPVARETAVSDPNSLLNSATPQVSGAAVVQQTGPSLITLPENAAQTLDGAAPQPSNQILVEYSELPEPSRSGATIQAATLAGQSSQSELRVGIQAGEFGNVDIRTSVIRNQLSAEISVEHSELRNLLAVDLPHLQTKLAEHPLTATNIVLSNYAGDGSTSSRHSHRQQPTLPQSSNSKQNESQRFSPLPTSVEAQAPSLRLDLHM
jgi:flagellar hook-length control protein FliK